jgi:hypothetical protein
LCPSSEKVLLKDPDLLPEIHEGLQDRSRVIREELVKGAVLRRPSLIIGENEEPLKDCIAGSLQHTFPIKISGNEIDSW